MQKTFYSQVVTYLPLILKSLAITLLVVMLYFQDLSIVFASALSSEQTFHILAIPPLFLYLLFRKRKMLTATMQQKTANSNAISTHFSLFAGILLSATAVIIYWNTSYTFTPLEYHMLTLPLFVAGLTLIFFNMQTLRQLLFPIVFLFFLTPPPVEILYTVGSTLSTLTAQASNALVNVFGMSSTLTASYGSPVITLTRPDQPPMSFSVDVACSGIYSLIGFVIFALTIAYITRGKIRNKIAVLVMGVPLIIALNIIRITTILTIGYHYGDEIALQIFHTVGATVIMFIGTLLLLGISEKAFKKPPTLKPCPTCNPKPQSAQEICPDCGKLLKPPKTKLMKSDLAKAACLAIVIMLLLSIQSPVFTLTEGPAEVLVQTSSGEQGNTQILPQIPNYNLQYGYRDKDFEQLSGADAALVYYYVPDDRTNITVIVSVEVASTTSSLHRWEFCLATYPLIEGYQPSITQLDLRDIQTQENPPITARYFAFQQSNPNQTQVVLYWYQTATFNINGASQKKLIMISLITFPANPQDVTEAENKLIPFAQKINEYWKPITAASLINLILSANGLILLAATMGMLVAVILLYGFYNRQEGLTLKKLQQKLQNQDKQLLEAVRQAEKTGTSTTKEIADQLQKIGIPIAINELQNKLYEAEKAGLIKRTINNKNDEPIIGWKNRIPEEHPTTEEPNSESPFINF